MRIALLAFALAGCIDVGPILPERPPPGTCAVEGLSRFVGRPGTPELGERARRRSGAARLRWIRPGDMVTMDFSPQRLNIHLDARNRVESFACG